MSVMAADPTEAPVFPPPPTWSCDQCHCPLPDRVGLSVLGDDAPDDEGPSEYGFCSIACLVAFVRRRWNGG